MNKIGIILSIILLSSLATAQINILDSDESFDTDRIINLEPPELSILQVINQTTSNNTFYWQGYTPTTFETYLNEIYCLLTGCTMIGQFNVGTDGSGHDVIFYSDTSDEYWWWDEDAREMKVYGTSYFDKNAVFHGGINVVNHIWFGLNPDYNEAIDPVIFFYPDINTLGISSGKTDDTANQLLLKTGSEDASGDTGDINIITLDASNIAGDIFLGAGNGTYPGEITLRTSQDLISRLGDNSGNSFFRLLNYDEEDVFNVSSYGNVTGNEFCTTAGVCLSDALTSYAETDPLWTANSTLVAYENQNATFENVTVSDTLNVDGNAYFDNYLYDQDSGGTTFIQFPGDGSIQLWSNGYPAAEFVGGTPSGHVYLGDGLEEVDFGVYGSTNQELLYVNSISDYVHVDGLLNVTNNATIQTGFFSYIGSAISRITKGWFTDLDVSGTASITTANITTLNVGDIYQRNETGFVVAYYNRSDGSATFYG